MISTDVLIEDPFVKSRAVLIKRHGTTSDLADMFRTRYRDWSLTECDTYLSGIAETAGRSARAVLLCVDTGSINADCVVAGLREAMEPETRLILCCHPEAESIARRALSSGADEYLLLPLDGVELDRAMGFHALAMPQAASVPTASMEELAQLADVLSCIGEQPTVVLKQLAKLVRLALHACGVNIIVEGTVATSGDSVAKPVLMAPIAGETSVAGQITVGQRVDEAYTPGDVAKLEHYARLAGHILRAASGHRRWQRLAMLDECSELPNRRYLHIRLDEILTRAAAERFTVTFLLFDLDNFKSYNDTYGHDAGDEILRVTGGLFRKHLREQDIVARYGGDEFAVVFWDPDGPRTVGSQHPDSALAVLDRFKEALRKQRFVHLGESGVGRLTISGGLATYPWDGSTREALIHSADQALLAAKRAGKNRIMLIGAGGEETNHPIRPGD